MEENNNLNQGVEETQETTPPETSDTGKPEKTFTQQELDNIVKERLKKEKNKYPSKEELTAFQQWKASQQTEQEKQAAILQEYETARQERDAYKQQLYLLQKGISPEDVDYYAYKIGKMVTDDTSFEDAAETFLKKQKPVNNVSVSFGSQQQQTTKQTLADRINQQLRGGI